MSDLCKERRATEVPSQRYAAPYLRLHSAGRPITHEAICRMITCQICGTHCYSKRNIQYSFRRSEPTKMLLRELNWASAGGGRGVGRSVSAREKRVWFLAARLVSYPRHRWLSVADWLSKLHLRLTTLRGSGFKVLTTKRNRSTGVHRWRPITAHS